VREQLRGFAAAVLGSAREAGHLARVRRELEVLSKAVFDSEPLYDTLTDGAIPVATRRAVVEDLLFEAAPATVQLAGEAIVAERPGDVPPTLEWLVERAGAEEQAAAAGQLAFPDPPAGRSAIKARLDGFATALFGYLEDRSEVDEVEDELFRFARTVEGSAALRGALTDPDVPVEVRQAVVADLVGGKVRPATARLIAYTVGAARARGLIDLLDWLVERAAAERGLRVADVRAAVDLDGGQRERLAAALSRMTGRPVELRITVDPSLVGGLRVLLGDTVIDGTIRSRLDRLRVELASRDTLARPSEVEG
jgi:F-type H+-transporting ATPase subunit delta